MLEGGVRYTEDRRTFDNCSIVMTDRFARFWNWNNVFANANAIARVVGQPASYGISFLGRF
jgi:hypothetical protein